MTTRVPGRDVRGACAILSRLLVLLTFVVFGAPQSQADGMTNAGPAADSNVEQAQGVLSDSRHLLRTQLPDDPSADLVSPGAAFEVLPRAHLAARLHVPHSARPSAAWPTLPPVRGPPAA
ncbi:hypothetical protein [Roseovarius sp. D0-M9]|uniref:hypothetical protein n=1 Tax=Roseovarius sp. D0-M9 TaxID=3127117 RepID=UPI0030103841